MKTVLKIVGGLIVCLIFFAGGEHCRASVARQLSRLVVEGGRGYDAAHRLVYC